MAKMKKANDTSCWQKSRAANSLLYYEWEFKLTQLLWKKCLTASTKAEYIYIYLTTQQSTPMHLSNDIYIYVFVSEDTYEDVLRGTIHNKNLGKFKCTSTREWTNCNIFR